MAAKKDPDRKMKSAPKVAKKGRETPVMQQHAAAKLAHPDAIVFFRLGDFYEMFGDDAVVCSRDLGLTLTSRNRGKPDEIPMAGVPHHAAHGYIARLLKKGHKVAICEQMADPSTVRGIVPREVVRVITAGTWIESEHIEERTNNWLAALEISEEGVGVALLDLSSAELIATKVADLSQVLSELSRQKPREVLVEGPQKLKGKPMPEGHDELRAALSEVLSGAQIRDDAQLLEREEAGWLSGVDVLGTDPIARRAAARVLRFARSCYKGQSLPVFRVGLWNPSGLLGIDRAAARHLELVESSSDEIDASLLSVIDSTKSPGGARLLRRRLLAPVTSVEEIERRLDGVTTLVQHPSIRKSLRQELSSVGDLERLSVRGSLREANPRDLGLLRKGLEAAAHALELLAELPDDASRATLGLGETIDAVSDLRERLAGALVDRPPAQAKEGAIFRPEFDAELAKYSRMRDSGQTAISEFEDRLRERIGVGTLRVRHTRVFGWYVEVGRAHAKKVPEDFRRKQTVANGERYTLEELDQLAIEISSAEDLFRARELALLDELMEELAKKAERIHRLAAFLSAIDVSAALAEVASDYDYQRPVVNESEALEIVDGRHPVVERLAAAGKFVPNDAHLHRGQEHLWIISGPNMAGKSTFLRQVALIVILAQMGSYVPAKSAKIGLVDKVLSRVGASDNLAGGESTFMVEMRETATILRSATGRSLVILDEVGRGTSTVDGLSIAWAVADHLDQAIGCRTLFATHYHELTELAEQSQTASNVCVSAREHEGDVIFLHRVVKGVTSRSYGIEVAQLAGLPEAVLAQARSLMDTFQRSASGAAPVAARRQLDLFGAPAPDKSEGEVIGTLRALDPDRLTGVEALSLLVQLKKRLSSN